MVLNVIYPGFLWQCDKILVADRVSASWFCQKVIKRCVQNNTIRERISSSETSNVRHFYTASLGSGVGSGPLRLGVMPPKSADDTHCVERSDMVGWFGAERGGSRVSRVSAIPARRWGFRMYCGLPMKTRMRLSKCPRSSQPRCCKQSVKSNDSMFLRISTQHDNYDK